jgi:hypothetical protein
MPMPPVVRNGKFFMNDEEAMKTQKFKSNLLKVASVGTSFFLCHFQSA